MCCKHTRQILVGVWLVSAIPPLAQPWYKRIGTSWQSRGVEAECKAFASRTWVVGPTRGLGFCNSPWFLWIKPPEPPTPPCTTRVRGVGGDCVCVCVCVARGANGTRPERKFPWVRPPARRPWLIMSAAASPTSKLAVVPGQGKQL